MCSRCLIYVCVLIDEWSNGQRTPGLRCRTRLDSEEQEDKDEEKQQQPQQQREQDEENEQ